MPHFLDFQCYKFFQVWGNCRLWQEIRPQRWTVEVKNTRKRYCRKNARSSVGVALRLTMAANVLAGRHHKFSSNHLS
jgi:hypothetical protein